MILRISSKLNDSTVGCAVFKLFAKISTSGSKDLRDPQATLGYYKGGYLNTWVKGQPSEIG